MTTRRGFAGADVPYPNAALIFVPTVPPGSTISRRVISRFRSAASVNFRRLSHR